MSRTAACAILTFAFLVRSVVADTCPSLSARAASGNPRGSHSVLWWKACPRAPALCRLHTPADVWLVGLLRAVGGRQAATRRKNVARQGAALRLSNGAAARSPQCMPPRLPMGVAQRWQRQKNPLRKSTHYLSWRGISEAYEGERVQYEGGRGLLRACAFASAHLHPTPCVDVGATELPQGRVPIP